MKALLWFRQLYSLYMKIALKALQNLLWGGAVGKDKGEWREEEIFSAIEIFVL